jgi:hypothetical protein
MVEMNGWVRNEAGQVELIAVTPGSVVAPNYATCAASGIGQ